MNPKPTLNRAPTSADMTSLIIDHSEDMLILAYTLTHNADRANRIVANILLDIYFKEDLVERSTPLHTWLYALVKEASENDTIANQ